MTDIGRRAFIRNTCLVCLAAGAGVSLVSCGAASVGVYKALSDKNKIIVPVSAFAEGKKSVIVSSGKLEYNVALIKDKETYQAIYMQCTHQDNPVIFGGKTFLCNSHGSTFDINGYPTKSPATEPLKKLKVEVSADNIYILI